MKVPKSSRTEMPSMGLSFLGGTGVPLFGGFKGKPTGNLETHTHTWPDAAKCNRYSAPSWILSDLHSDNSGVLYIHVGACEHLGCAKLPFLQVT